MGRRGEEQALKADQISRCGKVWSFRSPWTREIVGSNPTTLTMSFIGCRGNIAPLKGNQQFDSVMKQYTLLVGGNSTKYKCIMAL